MMPPLPLHTAATPYLSASADWLASVLDLFPRCVACGQTIAAGERPVLTGDGARRWRHDTPCGALAS